RSLMLTACTLLTSVQTAQADQIHRPEGSEGRAGLRRARPWLIPLIGCPTRPRSGCTAHGLREETATRVFVLASSIWLLEGPPVNDLMAIVKMRRNLRRRTANQRKYRPAVNLLSAKGEKA